MPSSTSATAPHGPPVSPRSPAVSILAAESLDLAVGGLGTGSRPIYSGRGHALTAGPPSRPPAHRDQLAARPPRAPRPRHLMSPAGVGHSLSWCRSPRVRRVRPVRPRLAPPGLRRRRVPLPPLRPPGQPPFHERRESPFPRPHGFDTIPVARIIHRGTVNNPRLDDQSRLSARSRTEAAG